jgi:hypothetical protein
MLWLRLRCPSVAAPSDWRGHDVVDYLKRRTLSLKAVIDNGSRTGRHLNTRSVPGPRAD